MLPSSIACGPTCCVAGVGRGLRSTGGGPTRRRFVGPPSSPPRGTRAARSTAGSRRRSSPAVQWPRRRPAPVPDRVDAGVDRVANVGVRGRRSHAPVPSHADELRREKDRVVRLVPGEPESDPRKDLPAPGRGTSRCTGARRRTRTGGGSSTSSAARRRLPSVRPGRGAHDREQHLDAGIVCTLDRTVVGRPLVRGIAGVGRVRRTPVRNTPSASPGQGHPHDLDVERLEQRKRVRRPERRGVVEETENEAFRREGRMRSKQHEHTQDEHHPGKTTRR